MYIISGKAIHFLWIIFALFCYRENVHGAPMFGGFIKSVLSRLFYTRRTPLLYSSGTSLNDSMQLSENSHKVVPESELIVKLDAFGTLRGNYATVSTAESSFLSYLPFYSWFFNTPSAQCQGGKSNRTSAEKRVRQFLGVPFAEKPARFESPKDKLPFEGVYEATQFKEGCPQWHYYTSEDCLFLNIFTPSKERLARHESGTVPVLFWIFGGGYLLGDSHFLGFYDGSSVVQEYDVIIVTHNYRLGPFGFLVTEDLEGNFGLEDQRMALQWVNKHISKFGGDPNRITIYGHSAGGLSTAFHMTSPPSQGLFSRAVILSPPLNVHVRSREEAIANGKLLTDALNCPAGSKQLACLRSKSVSTIVWNTHWFLPNIVESFRPMGEFLVWTPTIDNKNLIDGVFSGFDRVLNSSSFSSQSRIPLLIGTTRDETHLTEMIYAAVDTVFNLSEVFLSKSGFENFLRFVFKDRYEKVAEKYVPSSSSSVNRETAMNLFTSYGFTCTTRKLVRMFVDKNIPVYQYVLNEVPDYIIMGPCGKNKVCHGADLPYFFGSHTLSWPVRKLFSTKDKYLTRFYREMIVRFGWDALESIDKWDAILDIDREEYDVHDDHYPLCNVRGGNGRYDSIFKVFPRSDRKNEFYMNVHYPSHVESHYQRQTCDFWDTIGYEH